MLNPLLPDWLRPSRKAKTGLSTPFRSSHNDRGAGVPTILHMPSRIGPQHADFLDRLLADSGYEEYVGWSDDLKQLFYTDSFVQIWHGDPLLFFPTRVEIWFRSESGKPDRKLHEGYFFLSGLGG
jgi:hypothetical protein